MPPKTFHRVSLCCHRPNPEGVEVTVMRGRVLFWQCTNCHDMWHRWPEGTTEWALAEVTMARWTKRLARARAEYLERQEREVSADTEPPGQ